MPHFPLFAAAWIGSATPDVDLQLVLAGDLGPPPWHLIPIESSQSIEHVHCTLSDAIERLGKLMGRNLSSVVQPRFFQQALKPLLLVLFPEFMDHGAHLIGHTDLDILYGSRLSNLLAEMHVRRYDGIQLAHQPDYYAWGPLQVWSANAWRREVKPAVQFFLRRPWAAVPGNLYSWDEWSDGRFGGAGLNESMSGVLAPVMAAGRLRMWRHPFGFHGGSWPLTDAKCKKTPRGIGCQRGVCQLTLQRPNMSVDRWTSDLRGPSYDLSANVSYFMCHFQFAKQPWEHLASDTSRSLAQQVHRFVHPAGNMRYERLVADTEYESWFRVSLH